MNTSQWVVQRWFEASHSVEECFSDTAIKEYVMDAMEIGDVYDADVIKMYVTERWLDPSEVYDEDKLKEWALANMSKEDFPE